MEDGTSNYFYTFAVMMFFIYCLYFVSGCSTTGVQGTAEPKPRYELTLTGTLDGAPFQGIAVGSSNTSHSIQITSSVDINLFTAKTCHRSMKFEDVIQTNWITPKRSYSWSYAEAPTIEDTGNCLIKICAFSKEVGAEPSSCAMMDFKSDRYVLPGENICNGELGATTGTAICHTQVGLIERYRFKTPVMVAPNVVDSTVTLAPNTKATPSLIKNQCDGKFLDDNQTLFEYRVPASDCEVIFMERALPHREAKLTVIPYDMPQYSGALK
jgi:hypothetical protein